MLNSCNISNFHKIQNVDNYSIEFQTPSDEYNVYFKENLLRLFNSKNKQPKKYALKTSITFQSTQTLSVSGNNVLKSTKAQIDYQFKSIYTGKIIKSGSITTFPALSSSSRSLYSQEESIKNIKERLTKSAAKSLYMHIDILISKLS